MTPFYSFRQLAQPAQLATTYADGQHMATRFSDGIVVLLHHLPAGFFVELWYEPLFDKVAEMDKSA